MNEPRDTRTYLECLMNGYKRSKKTPFLRAYVYIVLCRDKDTAHHALPFPLSPIAPNVKDLVMLPPITRRCKGTHKQMARVPS